MPGAADTKFVKYEVKNRVAWVTLNRPEAMNALSRGLLADLATVFALHRAGRTRVVADTRPLATVNEAIGEVLHGQAKARIVLLP